MENAKRFVLSVLPEKLGICHLLKTAPVPDWALGGSFSSLTKTEKEMSIICPQELIPDGVLFEKNWRAIRLDTVLDVFASVGIIATLIEPLAKAGISILNVSTYETNYILVEEGSLSKAIEVLNGFCEIKQ